MTPSQPRIISHLAMKPINPFPFSTDFWATNHFTATYLGPGAPIADRFLGVYMSRAWASFAATGDPNNANVSSVYWPQYSHGGLNLVLQTQGSAVEVDNFREDGMKFIVDNIYF
ncbi:hypothetical protein B0H19DRAFT_1382528 [Mycena capillaripes]|nr:hypothetical protein B0H19DRAFT_1382528 [Mycena capillaripes]